ncbi:MULTISPECIES: flagellar hook-associated protein FlgL [Halomonadaceae]|uniref:Flagellar hook-associated protein 3 n=1 Tax=Vreelandella titanicae TaxID=664683 RepID=A0AAP9NQS4_9GAMM|nr:MULTISPECIES: flagellar hook-associated protein FlgL [Halomonas]QKS26350.1 Flagellar hook-associated protein 3 [Halomonas titanicae]CDG52468.1 Flagellar hook-associated protein 3 [Halomonas sp. A3H3]SDI77345.1 flagellar hook-associated protein 3 FlgL [Halomonas titanicae]|eukprot:TRINITY_DN14629_c0_g1_i1.p2 TRINITY_DN14629_c0_g1~~TRINITY_DN14629_c0_g1_i1.p2  ORF type:complete len:419 (-),score=21.85 TRINITY_DN14629_c0_g1_i1:362-1618(-)
MRISTVTMFEQSTASLNRQQGDLSKVSQQIASGRRVVNPSDDPQAASRAVGVDQSLAITDQYKDSRISARNTLSQTDSILGSIVDAIDSAKGRLVQASSDTLSDVDRESVASELKGIYETMIGQANATDGNGRYLFGGYKDNAQPFKKDASGNVEYQGDNNVREQRIDSTRLMAVADNGKTIFKSVPSSAGFVAEAKKDDGSLNSGNVTFRGPQIRDVNDVDYGTDFRITFNTPAETFDVETFDGTDWIPVATQTGVTYTGGDGGSAQQVTYGGVSINLEGTPAAGDSILVAQAGGEQREPDLFRAMEEAIRVLESPADTDAKKADLRNTLNTAMRDLDNALDNVSTVLASVGARVNELDVVDVVGGNRMLNYTETLSNLVDLDYAEAISEYSLRQVGLQAAQKTFVDIKGLSLLNYM